MYSTRRETLKGNVKCTARPAQGPRLNSRGASAAGYSTTRARRRLRAPRLDSRRGGRAERGGARGVGGLRRDAAHVAAALHADVAGFSPAAAPRVLHLPVVLATVGAESDDEDAVVEAGAARARVEHAVLVELEDRPVRLNGHRDRLLRHGRLERDLVVRGDVDVA